MKKSLAVYIAFEVFPRPKGASSHIASMVSAMAGAYDSVLLLCLGFGDMPAYQQEGNIVIRRFKGYHPNMLKRSELFSHFVHETLAEIENRIDVCVFRDPWGGIGALSSGVCHHTVFEVNALPSWELEYTYPGFAKNFSLKTKIEEMERFCLSGADKILTVSEITSKALRQKGVSFDKIKAIPNSAPDCFFEQKSNEPPPEFLKKGRWIGYFGSLHTWQGIENGVLAFSEICEAFPDVSLVIITGGRKEAKKRLRKIIRKKGLENQVRLHPPLASEKLADVVRQLEFTIAPLKETPRNTYQGCCPVKIIESMAAGTPVIASDLSCTRTIIKNNENGLLVPPDNIRALALSMMVALTKKEKTKTLGKNAFKKALAEYNREKIHREIINFIY